MIVLILVHMVWIAISVRLLNALWTQRIDPFFVELPRRYRYMNAACLGLQTSVMVYHLATMISEIT